MAQLNELLVTGASQLLNGLGILGSTTADSILPNSTDTYSLGSSGKKWKEAYITSVIGNADSATVLKNARTLKIGKTGKTFNGSANVSWTLAEIGAVAKAGDTMTGFLTLHANPTANLHAATKQYVDKTVENAAKLFTVTTTITTDTASSVVFDTSTVNLSTCLVYYNGLLMTPGVNYSITNNTTIALSGWTANKGDIFTVSGKQADETSVIAAGKLTCGTVGSTTKPVYFNNGVPVECTSIEDKKVTQSETTAPNYRPVVLGYTDNTDVSKLATSVTNQVYVSNKFYAQPSTGTFVATKFKGALEGNASTATKLKTARTITLDGDVKGSASFDGSGNITITTEAGASGISYVDGSGSTTAGTWIGTNTEISGLYTGLTIAYKIGVAGASTTTLNLTTAAGASGAKTIKRNASNLTTHLPVGTVVLLTYDGTNWCWADYSTADTKNTAGTTNSTSILYLAGATSQAANPQTYSHSAIKANCNSSGANEAGSLTATKVYGAVWNDYAEYRDQIDVIEPGYCVASTDDGKVYKTIEKFQACDGIVSDTFGFSIGETDNCKTPLAVAGRVLAYCEGDRNSYHAGDTVCASLNGKVMKMTREEIKEYPDRIVGVVSEIPTYEHWGSGNVKVNNRIWIKVK